MIAFMLGEITTKSFTINYYLYHGPEKESEWLSTVLVQNKTGKPIHTLIELGYTRSNTKVLMAWCFGI